MTCRVCSSNVKKSALLCSQCSLISHSKCAPNAPPTCDLRAQLLLYAQYAEKGDPASAYSNPLGNDTGRRTPVSIHQPDTEFAPIEHTIGITPFSKDTGKRLGRDRQTPSTTVLETIPGSRSTTPGDLESIDESESFRSYVHKTGPR